jgi:hypothetical protein
MAVTAAMKVAAAEAVTTAAPQKPEPLAADMNELARSCLSRMPESSGETSSHEGSETLIARSDALLAVRN